MPREFKRRHLIYYLNVHDALSNETIGQLVDISEGGIMLMSNEPFEEDGLFKLRIDAPSHDGRKLTKIEFEAEKMWAKQDVNPNFYIAGFKLLDLQADEAILIRELIDQLGFRD